MGQFVYVSLQDEDKIMVFGLDPTTGSLTLQSEVTATAVSYTHLTLPTNREV